MSFTLLNQINHSADDVLAEKQLLEDAIDFLGFNRDEVVCTLEELETLHRNMILEGMDEDKAMMRKKLAARANDRHADDEWLADLKRQGKEYKKSQATAKSIGTGNFKLQDKDLQPQEGNYVILPGGEFGKIVMMDKDDDGNVLVMIKGKRSGEKIYRGNQLTFGKEVNGQPTWMLKK